MLTEFNDYLAKKKPGVQERWLGPRTPLCEDEQEKEDDEEEKNKEDEGEGGGRSGQDELEGRDQGQVGRQSQKDRRGQASSH